MEFGVLFGPKSCGKTVFMCMYECCMEEVMWSSECSVSFFCLLFCLCEWCFIYYIKYCIVFDSGAL